MEDLHGMKRKQLQALCKKHGVPANLTNRQMADRLCLLLKEEGKDVNQGQLCSNDLGEISSENETKFVSKMVKKVRFSPENETFIFVGSDSDSGSDKEYTPAKKRKGRARSTKVERAGEMSVPRNLMDGPVRITRSRVQNVVKGDAVAIVGQKRLRRGTKVGGMEVNDVGIGEKEPPDVVGDNVAGVIKTHDMAERGSRKTRIAVVQGDFVAMVGQKRLRRGTKLGGVEVNDVEDSDKQPPDVVGENVAGVRNSHNMAKRGSRKTRIARGNDGVILLNDVSENNGNVGRISVDEKMEKQSRWNVMEKKKISDAQSRDTEKVEIVGRMTRSRGQLEGKVSAVASRTKTVEVQEELQLEEPLKCRKGEGSKGKFVAPQEDREKSRIVAAEASEPGRVLRRSKRNTGVDKGSELLAGNPRQRKDFGRARRTKGHILEKASTVDSESGTLAEQEERKDVPQLGQPLKGPCKNASAQESALPQKGETVSGRPATTKETTRRSSNADVEVAFEVEPIAEPTKANVKVSLTNGRRRKAKLNTFDSGPPVVGDSGNHETIGTKQPRESPQKGKSYAAEECLRRSRRNASRNNSTSASDEVDGVVDAARKEGQMKRRREPSLKEGSVTENEHLIGRPQRRSTRNAWKSELVVPAVQTCKVVEKEQQLRRRSMILEDAPSSITTLVPGGPANVHTRLAILDTVGKRIDSDSCCAEEISGKSTEKQKSPPGSSAKKGQNLLGVSAVNSHRKEMMDGTGTIEGTPLPASVRSYGVTTDQSTHNVAIESVVVIEDCILVDHVDGKFSSNNISEVDMDDRSCRLNDRGEASSLPVLEGRSKEPWSGEKMNVRNNNEDEQSAGDDPTSVQEDQNQHDNNEIAKPTIQEVASEDHRTDLMECLDSIKNIEDTSEKAEENSALDLFEGKEFGQAEVLVGNTETEQAISDSSLLTAETDGGTSGYVAPVSTLVRPAPEAPVSIISNEVTDNSPRTSSPEEDALEEEENQPGAKSCAQSTMLERSNRDHVGEEEFSGTEIPNKINCKDETSIGNKMEERRTMQNETKENEKEDELLSGSGSPALDGDLINRASEQNLRVDGGWLPDLDNKDCQAAEEKEKEVLDGNFDTFSGSCTHKLSSRGRISPITAGDGNTGRAEPLFTTMVGLYTPGSAKKGIPSRQPTFLRDNVEQEEGLHRKDQFISSFSNRNAVESGVALSHETENSVLSSSKVVDNAEERETRSDKIDFNYECPEHAAKEGRKSAFGPPFALEELQGRNKNETADGPNSLDEALPRSVEVCSAERSAARKATFGFHCRKAFPLEASTAVGCKEPFLDSLCDYEAGFTHKNSCVEPLYDMASSKNCMGSHGMATANGLEGELECSQQVELCDHVGWEANQANSSSVQNTFADSGSFDNTVERGKATSGFIGGVNNLQEEEILAHLERRSDAVFIDDALLQKVTSGDLGDHVVEGEWAASDKITDNNKDFQSSAVEPHEIASTVTLEKMGRTQLPATPVKQEKPLDGCANEFPNTTSVSPSIEVLLRDHEAQEGKSNGLVRTILHVNEVRFGKLDNRMDNFPVSDKGASFDSDSPMPMDHNPANGSDNFQNVDEDQEPNDDRLEAQEKDCNVDMQFISEDSGYGNVDKEHVENDSDFDVMSNNSHEIKTVAADEASAESIGGNNDSEKFEDGAKWSEKAPVSLPLVDGSSKWDGAEKTNSFLDTSCGKPGTHSPSVVVSLPRVSSSHGNENGLGVLTPRNSYDAKGKEITDDGRDIVVSVRRIEGAQKNEGLGDAAIGNSATISQNYREQQLHGLDGGLTHDDHFEKLHIITSEKSEVDAYHIAVSPVIALPSFGDGEQGDAEISVGALETNLRSKHSENSAKMKENTMIRGKYQKDSEELLGELKHQAHFAISDESICRDGGGKNVQGDISAIVLEHIDCKDYESSRVSVHSIEVTEINSCNSASHGAMAESIPDEIAISCHFPEEKLAGVNYSEHDVILDHTHENLRVTDQAGETSMNPLIDPVYIKNVNECVEKAHESSKGTRGGSKIGERSSSDVNMDRSCATTELDVSSLQETKALELNDDLLAFTSWEKDLFLGEFGQDEIISEQIAVEQNGDHEHHKAGDVLRMEDTRLAVSDKLIQENVGCENEPRLNKVECSSSKYSEALMEAAETYASNTVTAVEVMVECGLHELKQEESVANRGAGDDKFLTEGEGNECIVEAAELSQNVSRIKARPLEISPASTKMVDGGDIAAPDVQTPEQQLESPEKSSSDVKLEEADLSTRQVNSLMIKGTKCKTNPIPRTHKNLLKTWNMKENTPRTKNGAITAVKTFAKRRPLEDLKNN